MKAEELLESYFYSPDSEDIKAIVIAMKRYATMMCKKQREICAENAKTVRCPEYDKVNKESIINSPLPEELQ